MKNIASQQIDLATAAVLTTESVHVNFNQKSPSSPKQQLPTNSAATTPLKTPQSIIGNIDGTPTTITSNGGGGGPAIIDIPKSSSTTISATTTTSSAVQASGAGLRTIELSSGIVREGFGNFFYFDYYSNLYNI